MRQFQIFIICRSMFASWIPILPSQRKEEGYVNQFMEDFTPNQKSNLMYIITGVTLMTLAIVVTLLLSWAYTKDSKLFTAIIGIVAFGFSLNMFIYIIMIRDRISQHAFNYYLGLTVFMGFIYLLIFITFITMYMRRSSI